MACLVSPPVLQSSTRGCPCVDPDKELLVRDLMCSSVPGMLLCLSGLQFLL